MESQKRQRADRLETLFYPNESREHVLMGLFEDKRIRMIETQLVSRGIKNKRVLNAIKAVPRHRFVKPADMVRAYGDHPLPIGHGQTISQPFMVAAMTELLELNGSERVLEIGTGSGYQAAVLSRLAKEVYTVDRIGDLSEKAETVLSELRYDNVRFLVADGTSGWPGEAPFDRIIVTAGSPEIPDPLQRQLANNGLMVIPIGRSAYQVLTVIRNINCDYSRKELFGCMFVPLIGEYGWETDLFI